VNLGDELTRWTVRLALVCAILAILISWRSRHSLQGQSLAQAAWTLGCLAFLIHVGCAFHFVHHWSHSAAYEETAERTAALFGLHWGGGLYLNYAFTLVWVFDAAWWWCGLRLYQARPSWVGSAIRCFLAFMAFNATVVFGHGVVRWIGVGISLGLPLGWYLLRQRGSAG
jgi:hypothetical protein